MDALELCRHLITACLKVVQDLNQNYVDLSNNKRVVSIFPFCSAGHFVIAHDTSIHLHPAFYDVLPCQIELPNIASHHRVEMYRFDED